MIKLHELMLTAAIAALGTSVATAACPYPEEISVPDGSSATTEEMLDGQKQVKAYMAEMEQYINCLDGEAKAMGDAVTDEERALHVSRHNAAVDAMEKVATSFNEQIREYKAVNN